MARLLLEAGADKDRSSGSCQAAMGDSFGLESLTYCCRAYVSGVYIKIMGLLIGSVRFITSSSRKYRCLLGL